MGPARTGIDRCEAMGSVEKNNSYDINYLDEVRFLNPNDTARLVFYYLAMFGLEGFIQVAVRADSLPA